MSADHGIGVIGLGVMGSSLAMNLAERSGLRVAGVDLTPEKVTGATTRAATEGLSSQFTAFGALEPFVAALATPRRIILLVPAGKPVDSALASLGDVLDAGDVVMDGGNEWFENTERRQAALMTKGIHYMGCGVSGGEEGARVGPALMAGGPKAAYALMEPALRSIAARSPSGGICLAHMGDGGAGNYVKMVHNGIEYGDMQLIGEAYEVLATVGGYSNAQCADIMSQWNQGVLGSFLVEISALILATPDDGGVLASGHNNNNSTEVASNAASAPPAGGVCAPKADLVDRVLDVCGSKGTGKWTVQDAADRGVPLNTVSAALNGRFMSSVKAQRQLAAKAVATAENALLAQAPDDNSSSSSSGMSGGNGDGDGGDNNNSSSELPSKKVQIDFAGLPDAGTSSFRAKGSLVGQLIAPDGLERCLEDALLCCKLCSYAQGLALIATAAVEKGWAGKGGLSLAAIVRTWQGGCIIRASLLGHIEAAFEADPNLPNLLLDPGVLALLLPRVPNWRRAVALCALAGVPAPALADSLAYFDAYRTPHLRTASLIQAQRDCFGGHTYKRSDQEGTFHSVWSGAKAP